MLDKSFLEITLGYRIVEIFGSLFKIYLPTIEVMHEAKFYGELVYQKALKQNIPNSSTDLESRIISDQEFSFLERYNAERKKTQIQLELINLVGRKKLIEKKLEKLDQEYNRILYKKAKVESISADGIRWRAESMYCFFKSIFSPTDQLFWESYDSYLDDEYYGRRSLLFHEFTNFCNSFNDKSLRTIAKQPFYRSAWNSAVESGASIFKDFKSMSVPALRLAYWIQLYSNVIANCSDITEEIIMDDDSFDRFVENQSNKHKPVSETGMQIDVI